MNTLYAIKVELINTTTKTLTFDKTFKKTAIVESSSLNAAIDSAINIVSHQCGKKKHLLYASYSSVKKISIPHRYIDALKPRPYCYIENSSPIISIAELARMNNIELTYKNMQFNSNGDIQYQTFNGKCWIDKTLPKAQYEEWCGLKVVAVYGKEHVLCEYA